MTLLSSIHLNDLVSVDGVELVWVHHHTEETGVGLREGEGRRGGK